MSARGNAAPRALTEGREAVYDGYAAASRALDVIEELYAAGKDAEAAELLHRVLNVLEEVANGKRRR